MSWQGYVDTNLVSTGKISQAAILGLKGGVWAASAGYTLKPEEQKAIVDGFADLNQVQAQGIRAGGQKYIVTTTEPNRSIYGKKGGDGIIIVKTKQAALVAEYVAPTQASEVAKVVGDLADYLIKLEY